MSSPRLRLALCSPLSSGSGRGTVAADFADQVLPYLRQIADVVCFDDQFIERPNERVHHYLTLREHDRRERFDVVLYAIEDHPAADFARAHCGLMPGLSIFHHFVCQHPGPEPFANSPWESTVELMLQRRSSFWPRTPYPEYRPHALREAGVSVSALFTDERSHDEWRRLRRGSIAEIVPETVRSAVIPAPVPIPRERSPFRRRVLFCGSPRIEHRGHVLLSAIANLGSGAPEVVWLVSDNEINVARELVRDCEVSGVTIVGRRSPALWRELIAEGGVAVHTLFSVYGSLMPYLASSLAAGLPCVVSRFGSGDVLPDDRVVKINPGRDECRELGAVLEALCSNASGLYQSLSSRGREYAAEVHDARSVSVELATHLAGLVPWLSSVRARHDAITKGAAVALQGEVSRLVGPRITRGDMWRDGEALWQRSLAPVFTELGWRVS